jgi:hypothetical protein
MNLGSVKFLSGREGECGASIIVLKKPVQKSIPPSFFQREEAFLNGFDNRFRFLKG